ncbi:MAG: fumarate hydratase [Spirochaetaceae bacterium]|jgi:fumarate hydratase subunit alpha|nr:fumarate hydratase [Spirochaetaceae bacterium]
MRVVKADLLADTVRALFIEANHSLPEDARSCLWRAKEAETGRLAQNILGSIIANYKLAGSCGIPICQDTGMACVFIELGENVYIEGGLTAAIDEGVRRGCADGYLRASIVGDPLKRVNTGDNTPALLSVDIVPGDNVSVTVAPKGAGSENMSAIRMLVPGDGVEGIEQFVLETVEKAGANPCPPVVVGIGIGGSFDKAALISKKALLRPLRKPHADPYYAEMERRLLEKINNTGIGPQGLGGKTTALAVAVETMPCHIASLPCAVNLNCHVARHKTAVL